jgi:hypothetical protein
MKKHLTTIFLMGFVLGYAQNGYIEVEVRDTLALKPISFEYIVGLDDTDVYAFEAPETYNPKKEKEKKAAAFKVLKQKLTELEISFVLDHPDPYMIQPSIEMYTDLKIKVDTEQELKELVQKLAKIEGIRGSLGTIQYKETNAQEDELLEFLIRKAQAKAQKIAALTGQKLGKVISVTEVPETDEKNLNILDTYLIALGSGAKSFSYFTGYGSMSKALIVRFSAN